MTVATAVAVAQPRPFPPRVQSRWIPFHAVLYDAAMHDSLVDARECFNDNFPVCIAENPEEITNVRLLQATRVAEAFLHNFSLYYGIIGPTGDMLHMRFKDDATQTSLPSSRVAEIFCMLGIMMNHSTYQMLRVVYSVVYSRSKAYAALRDVRYIFNDTKNRTTLHGRHEFFKDLVIMLREFVHLASENSKSDTRPDITRQAVSDFNGFVTDEDETINLIDHNNFGTAIALAINVYESCTRSNRPLAI